MKKSKKKKKNYFGPDNVGADVARRKKAASGFGYLNLPKDVPIYKESSGKSKIDIIPYIVSVDNHPDANQDNENGKEGNPWYKHPIYIHRNVGAENKSIVCPKTIGKKCPLCEERARQFAEGMDKDDVVPKASLRNLYVVIPIGHDDYDEDFHIWDISNFLFQDKLDDELEENPDYYGFPNPEGGYTLRVRFTEKELGKNKFNEVSRIDFDPRPEGTYEDDIMDKAPCLDECFTVLSYNELEAMFLEIEEEEDDPKDKEGKGGAGEEGEKEPKKMKRKKKGDKSKKKGK